jgi:polyisoprenoid-binding protein YceI
MRRLKPPVGCLLVATASLALWTSAPILGREPGHQAATDQTRFELAATGNEARYRVREQLAGFEFPNDAVGVTSAITGVVLLDADGDVVPDSSSLTVDVTNLTSDEGRRDRYVRGQLLETTEHPTVVLEVKELRGLPWPLPASGQLTLQLLGDLTVKGVTRPSTWQVTATPKAGGLAGTARTSFTFADFAMTKPTFAFLLSVDDTITLEYDFHLVPAEPGSPTRTSTEVAPSTTTVAGVASAASSVR